MKKILCLLLLCCMLPMPALGDQLRLFEVDGNRFFRERGIQTRDVCADPWNTDWDGLMQDQAAPDLLSLRPDDAARLTQKGYLADLSGSETIANHISRMVPWAQQAVTNGQGYIFAVPQYHYVNCFFWNADAFSAAGLTQEDVPQSYTQLLDFLEAWCARLETQGAQPACITRMVRWNTGTEAYNYCYWLLETLLTCWEAQQTCAGQQVRFDHPEFIALAERSRAVAMQLYRLEPRERKRQNLPELFTNNIRGGKFSEYYNRETFLSQTMPLRITDDQPEVVRASMKVWAVRAGSAYQDEATAYIEDRLTSLTTGSPMLYADHPGGVKEDSVISQSWLDDYHAYTGKVLYLRSVFDQTRDAETHKEACMMQFFQGRLSAGELAQKLDER